MLRVPCGGGDQPNGAELPALRSRISFLYPRSAYAKHRLRKGIKRKNPPMADCSFHLVVEIIGLLRVPCGGDQPNEAELPALRSRISFLYPRSAYAKHRLRKGIKRKNPPQGGLFFPFGCGDNRIAVRSLRGGNQMTIFTNVHE